MRRWGIRTSSCAARSRACGPICHRTRRAMRRMTSDIRTRSSLIAVIALAGAARCLADRRVQLPLKRAGAGSLRHAAAAGAARHDQAVLRRVSQRPREDRPASASRDSRRRASASMPTCSRRRCASCAGASCRRPALEQPDAAAIDSLVAWLEDSLDRAAGQAHVPDQVVLHRLNRKEYANAVRDLLAVDFDATRGAAGRRRRPRASTTSRRRCRCRRPSSSNTSSPRAPWP